MPDIVTTTPPPEAFARLFESVHEGVYIGTLSALDAVTLSANPYLKLMFGFATETPPTDVRPFDVDRFIDPQAREGFLERLGHDGSVTDYLLRVRRAESHAHVGRGDSARGAAARRPAARRGAHARRQRAQAARGPGPRPLSPAAAGGKARSARSDDFRRRPRVEQPARHDPDLGRAPGAAQRGRSDAARSRNDSERVRTRREDRPQPAHLRAQAAHDARDGGPQPGRARDAGPPFCTSSA